MEGYRDIFARARRKFENSIYAKTEHISVSMSTKAFCSAQKYKN